MTKYNFKFLFSLAFALLFSASAAFASSANRPVDKNWTVYSSFDNMPRKIIDTPELTYFLVHNRPYYTTKYGFYLSYPAGGIFFIDKKNPDAGMQDFLKSVNLSGFDIRNMEVDPATGRIVIAYMDGGIDIISPDHKVAYFDDLKNLSGLKSFVINSISFDADNHNIWVAGGSGFIRINPNTLSVDIMAQWKESVNDIIPVGNKVIAIVGNKICEAEAEADIMFRDSFKTIASATVNTPLRLMALSPTHFAYVTANGTIQQLALDTAKNKWTRTQLLSNSKMLLTADQAVTNRTEHTVTQTAKGYLISATDAVYQLNRPENGAKAPAFIKTALPAGSTLFSASYDLNKFWFYRERGYFFSRTLSEQSWSDPSADIRPEAPLTAKDIDFIHSPEYGFIAVNRMCGFKSSFYEGLQPILISSFKNGKWKNLSSAYNPPYYTDDNPTGAAKFKENCGFYPGHDPQGILIDPLFPYALHTGNLWVGHSVSYLDDPRRNPIVNVSSSSGFSAPDLPTNKIFPRINWGSFVGGCLLGIDGDNNIWVSRSNVYPTDGSSQNLLCLWAWTPEARKEAIENSDYTKAGEWKKIEVDTDIWMQTVTSGLALRHPKNNHKLISWAQGEDPIGRAIRIYNHNGTIEDTSDDKLDVLHYFKRDDGQIAGIAYPNYMIEDQLSGDVLIFTNTSLYIVDLSKPVENFTIEAKTLSVKSEDGSELTLGQTLEAYAACFDEYGRLWVGTAKDGVYGFSKDRKKVIAHYNTANSPIPSDAIHGVGWNPDTKSLFISTDMAIAQVKVDIDPSADSSVMADSIFATPDFVNPDYTGTIAIHNIPEGTTLRVRDADGKTIADICDIKDGSAHWNLLDRDGNRVPTGRYSISDTSGIPSFKPLTILVTR